MQKPPALDLWLHRVTQSALAQNLARWWLVCLAGVWVTACSLGSVQEYGAGSTGDPLCDSLLADFEQSVWEPILASKCLGCHVDGGVAASKNSRFLLVDEDQDGYLATNLERVLEFATVLAANGAPVLLLKPSGQAAKPHGGGVVVPQASAEYAALEEFLESAKGVGTCEGIGDPSGNDSTDTGNGGPAADGNDTGNSACVPLITYFEQNVWTPIFAGACLSCHVSGGAASDSQFVLQPATQAGYLQANLNVSKAMAQKKVNGTSVLLAKPTRAVSHGGGQRFATGSAQYNAIQAFIERAASPQPCD